MHLGLIIKGVRRGWKDTRGSGPELQIGNYEVLVSCGQLFRVVGLAGTRTLSLKTAKP
jgi:hypothetical protein